jgi:hypothetical protein
MTSLLVLNAILSTGIVIVIVGVLGLAIKHDRRPTAAPKLRATAPARSTTSQTSISLASAE